MAKTNFSIAVDEDNVKDLSTTEWRIIQEVGYGESNKEIAAKLFFLSEGTVRNYLSTILAKLNLRDRTQLAIWSVQTGVTRRDFLKEIQNEIEAKASLFRDRSPCCTLCECRFLLVETATDRTPYWRLCRF